MFPSLRILGGAALIAGGALAAAPAWADETDVPAALTVSASGGVVSDYRFRGLSQSSGDPAVQGGVTVTHASGAYAGAWGSTIDFGAVGPAAVATYGDGELDLYAGWSGEVASGITADLGVTYYAYPGGHVGRAEFFEPYASLSTTLGPATAKLGVNYAWKQAALNFDGGANDDNLYLYGELGAGIPNTPVSLSAHLGWTKGALSPNFATGRTLSYKGGFDYSIGASASVSRHLSLGLSYVGVDGRDLSGYSKDAVIGSLKLAF